MKILALDIATNTGIAIGSAGRDPQCWSVNLGEGRSHGERFSNIYKLVQGLQDLHKPDITIAEAAIGGKNASAYLQGLISVAQAASFGGRYRMVDVVAPGTVRKHFIGKAYTSRDFPGMSQAKGKIAIKELVKARAELLGWIIPDLDAADAAATWDWACVKYVKKHHAKPSGRLFT